MRRVGMWLATAACASLLTSFALPAPIVIRVAHAIQVRPPSSPLALPSNSTPLASPTLYVVGDVLLSRPLGESVGTYGEGEPARGFAQMLEPVARAWKRDPHAFVLANLESPVARLRHRVDRTRRGQVLTSRVAPVRLNAPRWLLEGLKQAEVDAVMLANNHALDQETRGLAETIQAANEAGLIVSGAGIGSSHWPLTIGSEKTISVVTAFNARRRDAPAPRAGVASVAYLGEHTFELVARAREESDAVVAVVHVLGELDEEPKPRWRRWADRLIEAGADVVAVHGTHVPGLIEEREAGGRRGLVAWGLGNFVSDMAWRASPRRGVSRSAPRKSDWPQARQGLVMRVSFEGDELSVRFLPTWMSDDRFVKWHSGLERPVRFELLPVAACRDITTPNDWVEPWAGEMRRYVAHHRDRMLRRTGLSARCSEDANQDFSWLAFDPTTAR